MDSIRKLALQAELDHIQAVAEAHSYAVMNKADTLASAHQLCSLINDGLDASLHFEAGVTYYEIGQGCEVRIFTLDRGDAFLRRAAECGIAWEDMGRAFADNVRRVYFDDFPGVCVFVRDRHLAACQLLDEAASA